MSDSDSFGRSASDTSLSPASAWDASQIKPPRWDHVFAAFVDGAREARANEGAADADFVRAADGYTKRVFEEVDPVSEEALRTSTVPSADDVICPACAHQFRAIPVNVQSLLLAAGFEPPFPDGWKQLDAAWAALAATKDVSNASGTK